MPRKHFLNYGGDSLSLNLLEHFFNRKDKESLINDITLVG
jgi:hypothetical protein